MTKNVGGYRPSTHIGRKVVQSIFDAIRYSRATDTPLNTYVVINLRESECGATATIFRAIRHKFRDWLAYRRRKYPALPAVAYVYALESPENRYPHSNWVLHVPEELRSEFTRKLPLWVAKAQGSCGSFDVDVQSVDQAYIPALSKYVLKGADPAYVSHFHLERVANDHGPQGIVWGKRAGASLTLDRAARRAAGWTRPRRWQGRTAKASAGDSQRSVVMGPMQTPSRLF